VSEETRTRRLRTLDEQIASSIEQSRSTGELQTSRDWGKPLELGDGYDETPEDLRMAFKALKDSGFAPPEVQMMRDLAAMRARLAVMPGDSTDALRLRREIGDFEVDLRLRIEALGK
jgi:hypothetical protein